MSLTVEFMNIAPDTVGILNVSEIAPESLDIPQDAMQFQYFENGAPVGPRYYVTDAVEIGTLHELQERHPDDRIHGETGGAIRFARVSWEAGGDGRYGGSMFVPLRPEVAVIDRATKALVVDEPVPTPTLT